MVGIQNRNRKDLPLLQSGDYGGGSTAAEKIEESASLEHEKRQEEEITSVQAICRCQP